jgi:hypothetical protein
MNRIRDFILKRDLEGRLNIVIYQLEYIKCRHLKSNLTCLLIKNLFFKVIGADYISDDIFLRICNTHDVLQCPYL